MELGAAELAGSDVEEGYAITVPGSDCSEIVGIGLEDPFGSDRSRSDELRYLTPHQALGLCSRLHLIGDRDPDPQPEERLDVPVGAAHRDTGHGGW